MVVAPGCDVISAEFRTTGGDGVSVDMLETLCVAKFIDVPSQISF